MNLKLWRAVFAIAATAATGAAGAWTVSREIVGEAASTQVVAVPLDDAVFAVAQDALADVRVLDAGGREVPRVIQPARDFTFERRDTPRMARLEQVEPLPDGGLAVVCKLDGTNRVSLTKMAVHTPLRNYEQTVTIQVMGPDGAWIPAKAAEPLFDYSRFADVKKEAVDLPGLTNRVFKLLIDKADDAIFSAYTSMSEETGGDKAVRSVVKRYDVERRPFRIDAVEFWEAHEVAVAHPRLQRIAIDAAQVSAQTVEKTTTLIVPAGRHPVVGVALAPEQQNFERRVSVEVPAPGGWRMIAQGVVARVRLPGMPDQDRRNVSLPEVRAEQLRMTIANDDNPPLTFGEGGVTLVRPAYALAFIAEKGERYRLVYGDPSPVRPPVYERGVVTYLDQGRTAATWMLADAPDGPVAYGAFVRIRQFLASHALTLISLLVMLVLGLLILRAAKTERR